MLNSGFESIFFRGMNTDLIYLALKGCAGMNF